MRRSGFVRLSSAFSLFLGLAGCSDATDPNAPLPPTEPNAVLLNGGNGHFFFLTPLGTGGGEGVFNPRLAPVVEVCHLATATMPEIGTPCDGLIARFTREAVDPSEQIEVNVRREMYSVNWDLSRYALPTGYYRITVRTAPSTGANTVLGIADVAVGPSIGVAGQMAGPGVHAATTSQTLPIKFRIEEGALCDTGNDCFEGSVGPDGGTFVTPALAAGVLFPENALSSTRTLLIERVTRADEPFCLPTHHPQYEGCYRFRLEPALAPGETFATEVVVGVCLDPAAAAFEDELELQKWDEVDPSTLESLPRREIDFLECDDFLATQTAATGLVSRLTRGTTRVLAPLARLLLPQPLYATKSPYGGGLNDFSLIGWVRPLDLEVAAGDGQTACFDERVAIDPTVRVSSLLTGTALSGVPVSFTATAGGGAALSPGESTDGDGLATAGWMLGDAGSNELRVDGRNPLTGWPQWTDVPPVWGSLTMTATAEAPGYLATFLDPLGSGLSGSDAFVSGLSPALQLCELDGAGNCAVVVATYGGFTEFTAHRMYALAWTPPSMEPGTIYRIAIEVEGRTTGSVLITADPSLAGDAVELVHPGVTITVNVDLVPASSCAN